MRQIGIRTRGPHWFWVQEALKDIAAIAQVDTEESDSETSERQLDDIIEYLRFAAINTVMEAQALQETDLEDHQS